MLSGLQTCAACISFEKTTCTNGIHLKDLRECKLQHSHHSAQSINRKVESTLAQIQSQCHGDMKNIPCRGRSLNMPILSRRPLSWVLATQHGLISTIGLICTANDKC